VPGTPRLSVCGRPQEERRNETCLRLLDIFRDAEVLAVEAGCDQYCEIELDDVELQGDRVYLHLGIRRDTPPRR
jgi:hypothetical protein